MASRFLCHFRGILCKKNHGGPQKWSIYSRKWNTCKQGKTTCSYGVSCPQPCASQSQLPWLWRLHTLDPIIPSQQMAVSENGVYLCKVSFNGKFKGSINCLVLCILPGNWVYLWKIGLTWKFMIHRWLWGYLCKESMMTGCTSCHGFNTRMLPWLQLEFGSERRNLGTFESSRTNSIHLYGWIILEKSHCDVILK